MRNYLIAGAGGGIGRALAETLYKEGHQLYLMTSQPETLSQLKGAKFLDNGFMQDDWKPTDLPAQLDGLVYCPGTINLKPFRGLKAADFRNDFEINVMGAVRLLQAAFKALKAGNAPAVVLFSTVAVAQGMPFHSSVAAAKAAVEGLAKSLAAEWAPTIRVNVIAPSLTDTPLAAKLLGTLEKVEASAKRHPLNKVGSPDDIAAIAAFLLSEKTSWITGQVIGVDGGMSALSV
ncbi:MAG: SDR family oxidoreductase [Bacteroidetes bacterium]|nr:SDR family oxidoreductase [Bacteroidota bacterium]MBU1579658.1 SDR family oxidoreductase [Bacteroidota bacterium]MBU2465334.1 SDR family oxidoreductase [Bacteroidota bacterium]MBU2557445.1 SDR family oxidoreductase [Bacteroidota bacterium]